MSPLKDFHFIAADYLILINQLNERWKNQPSGISKQQLDLLARLEVFYDACLSIITRADQEAHLQKLHALNEHVKSAILESELKKAYNKIYTANPSLAAELLKETALPTKKELEKEVHVK